MRWGLGIEDNHGGFLLGINLDISKINDMYLQVFICIHMGFKTLVIGRGCIFKSSMEGYDEYEE